MGRDVAERQDEKRSLQQGRRCCCDLNKGKYVAAITN